MKTITIACKREDIGFIQKSKNIFEVIESKETSVIGLESWILISIALAQLTLQAFSFFKENVNGNPNRQVVSKDGRYPINFDNDDDLTNELNRRLDE